MVPEIPENFKKPFLGQEVRAALVLTVVACASFALGNYSADNRMAQESLQAAVQQAQSERGASEPQELSETIDKTASTHPASSPQNAGGYVASKGGTKYHLPWCGSAQRIKEENKIWFDTKEEAEAAGYKPAANCKGI